MSLPKVIQTGLTEQTAASTASVSTADAKSHLKVEHTTDDTLIGNLVYAAEKVIEADTKRKLISTTYDFYLTDWPVDGIVLPVSPVTSITSVKYYDTDNAQQTWASANYHYNLYEEPTVIRYVDTPPDSYEDRSDAIVVRFVAGYADAAAVPEGLVSAVLLKVGDLYENRVDAPRESTNTAWMHCAAPYKVFHNPEENAK